MLTIDSHELQDPDHSQGKRVPGHLIAVVKHEPHIASMCAVDQFCRASRLSGGVMRRCGVEGDTTCSFCRYLGDSGAVVVEFDAHFSHYEVDMVSWDAAVCCESPPIFLSSCRVLGTYLKFLDDAVKIVGSVEFEPLEDTNDDVDVPRGGAARA